MILTLFFIVIALFMIADDLSIREDIKASSKKKFTKQDAVHYYKNDL